MKTSLFTLLMLFMSISLFAQNTQTANTRKAPNRIIRPVKDSIAVYNEGVNYLRANNYQKAVECFKYSADKGVAAAQYSLGICYENGYGVNQDFTQAAKYYRMGAIQGEINCMYNLGILYYNGQGVEQSYAEAAKCWEVPAEKGQSDAQYNLATLYEGGFGVTKDVAKAVSLYRKAAAQGNENARAVLSQMGY